MITIIPDESTRCGPLVLMKMEERPSEFERLVDVLTKMASYGISADAISQRLTIFAWPQKEGAQS